jgi:hypothetical protein
LTEEETQQQSFRRSVLTEAGKGTVLKSKANKRFSAA